MMFQLARIRKNILRDGFQLVGIEFNTSGTKLFIYDKTGTDKIKQYSLNSPYNYQI